MGDGELDQLSLSIGRLEGRFEAGIATLKDAVESLTEKMTGVITAVHSHGERIEKVESTAKMLSDHHVGRTAISRFLKNFPYMAVGGALGTVATQTPWKSLIGVLMR